MTARLPRRLRRPLLVAQVLLVALVAFVASTAVSAQDDARPQARPAGETSISCASGAEQGADARCGASSRR